MPSETEDEVDRWAQSAALLHSNGDAVDVAVKDGRIVSVRDHEPSRANHGYLDPWDLFGWRANNFSHRLTRPLVLEGGRHVEIHQDTEVCRIECLCLGGTTNPKRHPTLQGIAF